MEFRFFPCIIFYQARQFNRSYVVALTVMSAAFADKDFIAVLYFIQGTYALYRRFQNAF